MTERTDRRLRLAEMTAAAAFLLAATAAGAAFGPIVGCLMGAASLLAGWWITR